jgi:hypothetical protein
LIIIVSVFVPLDYRLLGPFSATTYPRCFDKRCFDSRYDVTPAFTDFNDGDKLVLTDFEYIDQVTPPIWNVDCRYNSETSDITGDPPYQQYSVFPRIRECYVFAPGYWLKIDVFAMVYLDWIDLSTEEPLSSWQLPAACDSYTVIAMQDGYRGHVSLLVDEPNLPTWDG